MLRALRAESGPEGLRVPPQLRPLCARPAQPWDGRHGRDRV